MTSQLIRWSSVRRSDWVFMAAFLRLACAILRLIGVKAYPDVPPAIQTLSAAGIRLGFLSNLTEANIKSAGLEGRFEQLLSTDRVQAP